jgi:hypothetical protein
VNNNSKTPFISTPLYNSTSLVITSSKVNKPHLRLSSSSVLIKFLFINIGAKSLSPKAFFQSVKPILNLSSQLIGPAVDKYVPYCSDTGSPI